MSRFGFGPLGANVSSQSTSGAPVSFDVFEFDPRTGDLRREGVPIRLQPQPAKILAILTSRPGEIVTRQELAQQVWGSETFVDFEQGLNFAVRQIRSALADEVEHPRFLETLPKRGYRFIAATTVRGPSPQGPSQNEEPALPSHTAVASPRYGALLAVLAALLLGLALLWKPGRHFLQAQPIAHHINSLAVLPLRNLSQDPDQEYFSDGLTDELITDLAKSSGLRVISHTSVERYKGTKLSLPEIAQQLGGVDAVLEGTVSRVGDRVRISAQLIDAHSDEHLWADSYDRSLRDVLDVENEVSRSIAQAIKVNLSTQGRTSLASVGPIDPEAHDAYLKGRFFWARRTEPDLKKAVDSFQLAIAKDPKYAPAYAGLADTYFYLGYAFGHMRPTDAMPLARNAALKAIELDPNSSEGHASLATVELTYDWNFAGAELEFQRAIALNPNSEWAHHVYSALLISAGRPEQAVAEARKAVEVDPVSSSARNILGNILVEAGRVDEAIQEDKKTLEIDPDPLNTAMIHVRLQNSYRSKGMNQEAIEEHFKLLQASGVDANEVSKHRRIYAEKGWRGLDENELDASLAGWEKDHWHFNAIGLAMVYARLGEKDQAFAWLNKCLELRSTMLYLIDALPDFAPLRSDPRYAELKRSMKFSS